MAKTIISSKIQPRTPKTPKNNNKNLIKLQNPTKI